MSDLALDTVHRGAADVRNVVYAEQMPELLDRVEAIIRNEFPEVERAGRDARNGNTLFRVGNGGNALRVEVTETVIEDGDAAAAGLLQSLPERLKSLRQTRVLILTTNGILTAADEG